MPRGQTEDKPDSLVLGPSGQIEHTIIVVVLALVSAILAGTSKTVGVESSDGFVVRKLPQVQVDARPDSRRGGWQGGKLAPEREHILTGEEVP